MEPTRDQLLWMYEQMALIRLYEETMSKVYLEGKLPPHIQKGLAFDIGSGPVPGEMHLAAGQEPVAVGVCAHLTQHDTVVGTHRPHHFAIAKGVPLNEMTAEMFGKVTGLGQGKGGHMHLFDPVHKFSCSGIIGASLPPACGAGLANKMRKTDWVAVAFFGDGAANQGSFHESLNLAALWKLPVIFVVEDNKYAISVEKTESTSVPWNADRAAAYGMPGVLVERNDALEVYQAAGAAIARARRGEGPTLIEVKTDRYLGHFQGDAEVYRPKDETKELRKHDPIPVLGGHLRRLGMLDDAGDAAIQARVAAAVDDAFTFARNSAYPQPEEAFKHVFH
jgi:TPP-dependent pyruvate/acetoin dehydrogenase alpha subunit